MVRYDFFLKDPEGGSPQVVLNEANTVPGSFAFYLFEPAGLPFPELADALLDIAFAEAAERRATTRTFESVLIADTRGASAMPGIAVVASGGRSLEREVSLRSGGRAADALASSATT